MLRYNLDYVFNLKGIANRGKFLRENGFSRNQRLKLRRNSYREINFKLLEQLCLVFNCTPNDLIDFSPTEGKDYTGKAIVKLKKEKTELVLSNYLQNKSIEEAKEVHEKLKEVLK